MCSGFITVRRMNDDDVCVVYRTMWDSLGISHSHNCGNVELWEHRAVGTAIGT